VSLGIVIKGPEGLVLAAESRVTIEAQTPQGQALHVNFDHATKLLSFSAPNVGVGAVTYGLAAIGLRTAHSFLPEFEASLPSDERLSVRAFAQKLSSFFVQQWQAVMPRNFNGPNMTFVVAGFDEGEPYGRVMTFDIPSNPDPFEQFSGVTDFGINWGGQREFVDRLLQGFDNRLLDILSGTLHLQPDQLGALTSSLQGLQMPIPLAAMALQDCVNLATFFIRTTITAQQLTVGIRGCGGSIDAAIITRREGFRFIQHKQISGEFGTEIPERKSSCHL